MALGAIRRPIRTSAGTIPGRNIPRGILLPHGIHEVGFCTLNASKFPAVCQSSHVRTEDSARTSTSSVSDAAGIGRTSLWMRKSQVAEHGCRLISRTPPCPEIRRGDCPERFSAVPEAAVADPLRPRSVDEMHLVAGGPSIRFDAPHRRLFPSTRTSTTAPTAAVGAAEQVFTYEYEQRKKLHEPGFPADCR